MADSEGSEAPHRVDELVLPHTLHLLSLQGDDHPRGMSHLDVNGAPMKITFARE
jgi:hypothetical protein